MKFTPILILILLVASTTAYPQESVMMMTGDRVIVWERTDTSSVLVDLSQHKDTSIYVFPHGPFVVENHRQYGRTHIYAGYWHLGINSHYVVLLIPTRHNPDQGIRMTIDGQSVYFRYRVYSLDFIFAELRKRKYEKHRSMDRLGRMQYLRSLEKKL